MRSSCDDSADPRLDERSNVFLSATLHSETGTFPVRIRNLSDMGAMLDGAKLPDEGARVSLRRGRLAIKGEVAWRSGDFRGVRFDSQIDVDMWMKRVGHSGQQRVDRKIAALRVDPAAAAANLGDVADAKSVEELSEELLRICERLAASPNLTIDIGEAVMEVESIAQSLKTLSSNT